MKYFFTTLIITILLSGCATKNAFSKLKIDSEQELAIENTRTGQIKYEVEVEGVYSAVHLNAVYSRLRNEDTTFYISAYLKDKNADLNITLNKQEPIEIKELPQDNRFTHLQAIKNNWIKNYLVTFKKNKSLKLHLLIESGQFSSGLLKFPVE